MIKIKPQNPKGVRDFLPKENQRREYIISVIKKHYELYGFSSIYTPAFERLETLQGKYGDEGDKLLFKILNSGEYLTEDSIANVKTGNIKYSELTREISSKGLRYDLTVPLARLVSQHQNEISFPFKRYHIAPVWRADRPQKGRYQEFFQCDADIVGTNSLVADVELLNLISNVFSELNLKVQININNRKIYNGLCEFIGIEEESVRVSTILDKWDKIGEEKVREELTTLIGNEKTSDLLFWLDTKTLEGLKEKIINRSVFSSQLQLGIEEMDYILKHANGLSFDLRLLRGLDYYTGTVMEVVSTEVEFGSLLGGGRYDNLTEIFGLKDISGIGISFGLDRIYDLMEELGKFPEGIAETKVLIINLTLTAIEVYYNLLKELRKVDIKIDLYPSLAKMDKQFTYADKGNYSHAIIIGEDEMKEGKIQVKILKSREQKLVNNSQELISILKQ